MLIFVNTTKNFWGAMNKYRFLTVFLALSGVTLSAFAQSQITAVMGARPTLKAFSDAEGISELPALSVKAIVFPLRVLEVSDQGFVRVKIDDQQVWLDRRQLKMPPDTLEANCLTVNQANANLVAGGMRGANSGCK